MVQFTLKNLAGTSCLHDQSDVAKSASFFKVFSSSILKGKKVLQPRLTAWFGDFPYTYSRLTLKPFKVCLFLKY